MNETDTDDVFTYRPGRINLAYDKVRYYLKDVNDLVRYFLSVHPEPADFALYSDNWRKSEADIEDAIAENRWIDAENLAIKHRDRVHTYLMRLAKQLTNPRAAQAGQ